MLTVRDRRTRCLTVAWLVALTAFAVVRWWFGGVWAFLAFGLWAGPAALLAYLTARRTGRRWLRLAALLLVIPAVPAALVGWPGDVVYPVPDAWWLVPLASALPAWITVLACLTLWRDARGRSGGASLAALAVLSGVPLLAGAALWSYAEWHLLEASYDPRLEAFGAVTAVAGCYSVEFSPWVPPGPNAAVIGKIIPARVRLDTAQGGSGARAGEPGPPVTEERWLRYAEQGERLIRPGWRGSAYWDPIGTRHVALHWTVGTAGIMMRLRRHGMELRGLAETFTDYREWYWPEPTARVRLRPVSCDGDRV